jgi:16S rRNA (cytidine1402-2'-O)-methyltransferase
VVGPPGAAEPAGAAEVDAALRDAMTRLTVSRAAAEVAQRLGLPRREVYERALELK